jgi:hypothetical protein
MAATAATAATAASRPQRDVDVGVGRVVAWRMVRVWWLLCAVVVSGVSV